MDALRYGHALLNSKLLSLLKSHIVRRRCGIPASNRLTTLNCLNPLT
jgi:hypothetical protein